MDLEGDAKVMDTTAYCDDHSVYVRERDAQREASRVALEAYWATQNVDSHGPHVQLGRALMFEAAKALHCLCDALRRSSADTAGAWLDALRPSVFDERESYDADRLRHDAAIQVVSAARTAAAMVGYVVTRHSSLAELAETARQVLKSLP